MNDCPPGERNEDGYCELDGELWKPKAKVKKQIFEVQVDDNEGDVHFCVSKPVVLPDDDGFCKAPAGCWKQEEYVVKFVQAKQGRWLPVKDQWYTWGFTAPKGFIAGPVREQYSEESTCEFRVETATETEPATKPAKAVWVNPKDAMRQCDIYPTGLPDMFYPEISTEEDLIKGRKRYDCVRMDLDGDGAEEVLLMGTVAGGYCGSSGQCTTWLLQEAGSGWRIIYEGQPTFIVLITQTNTFPDLVQTMTPYGMGPKCRLCIRMKSNGEKYEEVETCHFNACDFGNGRKYDKCDILKW